MTRVDELQKKYPSIPREIIVRFDVLRVGLRDSDDLDKGSTWKPALRAYQSYDSDISIEEMAREKPHRFKPGFILRPSYFYMKNGLATAISKSTHSDYEIKDIGRGRFALFEGGEEVEEVFFYRPKPRVGPEPLTSKGTPISSLVSSRDCRFTIVPVRFCEYFSTGEQCKFCNWNTGLEQVRSLGQYRPVTIDLEDTVEAYKIRSSETRLVAGQFLMGGFRDTEQEGRIHFNFIEKIANAVSPKPSLTCVTEEMTRMDLQRLKDAGLDCIKIQLEIWGRQLFEEVCPGKASHAPYERWLECMQEAVEIFGFGSVGTTLIVGLNMMPANGYKTWQEGRDAHIEGVRWMIKNGILGILSLVRLNRGSIYGEDTSSWGKVPPMEYALDATLAHHEACEESGMYERMNNLLQPGTVFAEGHGGYNAEIGRLARCGDMGKWLSTFIPDDLNWLAQSMASMQLPANSQ